METPSVIPRNLASSDFFIVTGNKRAIAQINATIDADPVLTKLITIGDGEVSDRASVHPSFGYGYNGPEGRSALVHLLSELRFGATNRKRNPENKIRVVGDVRYDENTRSHKTYWSHWAYQQIGIDIHV